MSPVLDKCEFGLEEEVVSKQLLSIHLVVLLVMTQCSVTGG
jgi:hypothetical protein